MSTKREITKKYAREYSGASKKTHGRLLDELVATTGWSRANARRQVSAATKRRGPQQVVTRAPRPRTYGHDTLKLLIAVWRLAGQPSGKYLAATMGIWLPKLIEHGELDTERLSDHTRAQLLAVSGAPIDRLLKPTREGMRLGGISGTRPGPLLRTSITVRKAGDEHEQAPGFCEIDLVLHCGPTLKGQFARTLTVTDVHTGWTENIALKNGAHRWVLEAMPLIAARLPFALVGIDSDNGGEFINVALIAWAGEQGLDFTRSRPYHDNDNAHVEQKNARCRAPPRLPLPLSSPPPNYACSTSSCALVRVRLNLFTSGHQSDRVPLQPQRQERPRLRQAPHPLSARARLRGPGRREDRRADSPVRGHQPSRPHPPDHRDPNPPHPPRRHQDRRARRRSFASTTR